jgi:hypothetical protein
MPSHSDQGKIEDSGARLELYADFVRLAAIRSAQWFHITSSFPQHAYGQRRLGNVAVGALPEGLSIGVAEHLDAIAGLRACHRPHSSVAKLAQHRQILIRACVLHLIVVVSLLRDYDSTLNRCNNLSDR